MGAFKGDVVPLDESTPDAIFDGNREAWLQKIVDAWRPLFSRLRYDLPARIWISVGRPPSSRWTGACYPGQARDDGNPHIFVHHVVSDSTPYGGNCRLIAGAHNIDLISRSWAR